MPPLNELGGYNMTEKNKKLLIIILSAIALALAVALIIVLVVGGREPATGTPGPETGTYYFDSGTQEYTLTLSGGNQFTLYVKGGTEAGTYTLADKTLTLDFAAEGVDNIEATLENDVVTLNYNGASMRFLKKINYTVSFEVNGGSSLEAQTVLNGQSASKPVDPAREGFIFVGWYTDSEFQTPFAFGADPVTADLTLYARWIEDLLGGNEYTVYFDANYEGAEDPASIQTVGGKLFGLPTPIREGYEFAGWWVSMAENGEKLTYRCEEGATIDGSTTLYALWQSKDAGSKLAAPLVNVSSGSISWNAVSGARSYVVTVINADGVAIIDKEPTSATTFNVPFDTYAAGEYEIRVTALANTGDEDNAEAVRCFINKALGKVSQFEVIDSMLIFNTVEHAEKYLITVVCGNPEHQHTLFDNGNSRTFNFANCEMTEGGIRFAVTAVAEGYGSTTSREFVYCRDLDAVQGLRYDENTQTVHWNEVPNAAYYMVSVTCGNAAHSHAFHNNGGQTFVSLKECDACEGGIQVKVYAKTRGYNSPAASELTVQKKGPATPADIRVNGTTLVWTAVTGASKYEVQIGEQKFETTENSYDLSALAEGSDYTVSVRAIGDGESAWSDVQTIRYHEMGQNLTYNKGTLYWQGVIGATGYDIQVNDGEIITVSSDVQSARITLTKAGVNVLKVRFADGSSRSAWVQMEVFAHEVVFDTRGGSEIATRYLAVGDLTDLPTTTKPGYSFAAWYNVPGGPSANGMAYTEELFAQAGGMVLYAHYSPNKYTVTYDYGDGGTGEKTSDEVYYESHYQLLVPTANTPTSAFGGWFSAPYGMGVQYTDPKGNSLNPWGEAEDSHVYAYWIEAALTFTQTKVNTVDGYMVSAGAQIALLQEVTVPSTYNGLPVLMVAGNAFKDCTNLRVINLPANLTQISVINPFEGCSQLEAIHVYAVDGINNPRYWSSDGILFDNGNGAVAQPKLLTVPMAKSGTYRTPDGVAEIPERAFANSLLTTIVISADVTKIGQEAFADSTKLTSVVFENAYNGKPLTIHDRAFMGCTMLEKIILPARLESINLTKYRYTESGVLQYSVGNAFEKCTSLVSISVASGCKNYKSVDGVVFSGDGKTLLYCPADKKGAFTIPTGTIAVAPGAFIGCVELTQVTFPNTMTLIGECAFYGLYDGLEKITFAGGAINEMIIDRYAFSGCYALKEVEFEPGSRVAQLGEGAFDGCSGLENFSIPATMTKIGSAAFRDCTGLATISFAENGKSLVFEENVFYNCTGLTTVNLPAYVSEIPGIFGGCTALQEVNVAEDSPYFTSVEGVVFNKDMTEVFFFPHGKTGDYTLPATVTTIANGVFAGISGLKKLTITTTVTTIGENAFRDCNIDNIVFSRGRPDGGLTIGSHAFAGATFGKLSLPAHTVTISDNAFNGASFDQIVLNEGIETLGDYAFYSASGNKAIAIPASVKTIGAYCFAGANAWSSTVPVTMKSGDSELLTIGDYAFAYNTNLESIVIAASVAEIGDYAFQGCTYAGTVTFEGESGLKIIGAHAFDSVGTSYSDKLTTITIPKSVTTIGAYAFNNCSYLETVIFEEGGTEDLVLGALHVYTYLDYNGMTAQTIEHGHAFHNCDELKSVSFPSRLVEIGPYSFYYAAYYNSDGLQITFGENSRLATIGDYAFYGCNLVEITIPKSVRNLDPVVDSASGYSYDRMGIGAYAFAGNYNTLRSVIFEKGGTEGLTIGQNAFDNDDQLTSIEFPARLASYTSYSGDVYTPFANGSQVFHDAENLTNIFIEDGGNTYTDVDGVVYTADLKELVVCPMAKSGSVEVPGTVTKIHDKAFYECYNLGEITFVGGTEPMTIGDKAFYNCGKIKTIVLPSNVVSLGEGVFAVGDNDDSALESITLSKNLQNFNGGMIENCRSLKRIYVEEGSAYFSSDRGVLYNADRTALICCPTSFDETTYTVLPTVTVIGNSAFIGNTNIEVVILPAGLKEIEQYAFSGCTALKTVPIPNTVELIDGWAFSNCYGLSELSFEMGGDCVMVVGKYAFQRISTSDLTLPATMAVVGDYAFLNASIHNLDFESGSRLFSLGEQVFQSVPFTSVTLPDGLNNIGNGTFTHCLNLKNVVFGEGLVSIGANTFQGSAIESVYFPASLQNMGVKTFENCAQIKDVNFAPFAQLKAIPAGTFAGSSIQRFTVPAGVTEISNAVSGRGAFEGCANLESIVFAEGSKCTKIGVKAFKDCAALPAFTIPRSVHTLGEYAFESCAGLTSIIIPAGVTQLGGGVFSSCVNLTDVILNTKTTELPGYLFANCHKLTSIVIPASVSSIGNNCFVNTGIAELKVAEGSTTLKEINGVVFNADVTQIVVYPEKKADAVFNVPGTITSISSGILEDNPYLKELIFEEGEVPLVIEADAFYGMKALNRVVLPERLASVGEYAFGHCNNLMYLTVPASATAGTFGENAFYDCSRLLEIYNKSELELMMGSDDYGSVAYYALNIYTPTSGESKIITDENGFATLAAQINGVDGVYLVGYSGDAKEVMLPADITDIYSGVFADMDVTKVIIPEGVKTIGDEAFYSCGELTEVVLPSTLVSIGNYAFYDCQNLIQAAIPQSVTNMGYYAFRYCYSTLFLIGHAEQPAAWDTYWVSSSSPIIWNYDGAEHTYTFQKPGDVAIDAVTSRYAITLPTPVKAGHVFMGWYDNAQFEGKPVSETYYSTTKTTLYAMWVTQAEYEAMAGISFDNAIKLTLGESVTITIDEPGENVYLVYTNPGSTTYGNIACDFTGSTVSAERYEGEEREYVGYSYGIGGEGRNFYLSGGITYFVIYLEDSSATGTFQVTLTTY